MKLGFWKNGKRKIKYLDIVKPKNWTVREFHMFAEDMAERTEQELEIYDNS